MTMHSAGPTDSLYLFERLMDEAKA